MQSLSHPRTPGAAWIRRVAALAAAGLILALVACGGGADEPPRILAQPLSVGATEGQAATFTVNAEGTAPLRYQWERSLDGGITWAPISGATAASHAISSVAMTEHGQQLRVAVANAVGGTLSAVATLSVSAAATAPVITLQPLGQTAIIGTTVSLSVLATGSGTLSYRWTRDGVALADSAATTSRGAVSGSASATLTIDPFGADDAGVFAVEISNAAGSVRSADAALGAVLPTAFEVSDLQPSAGAYGVPPDAVIRITFSAPVDPASLAGGVFAMTDGDRRPVAGTLVVSGAVATFTPAAPLSLAVEQPYRVSVGRAATSLSGAMLDEDLSFNFTLNDPPGAAWEIRISTYWLNMFGRVRDSLGRIDCGVTSEICSAYFAQGSTVQFTATPLPGFEFLSWGGDRCGAFGAAPAISFAVNGSTVCGANFSPISGHLFTMTISTGAGVGRVIDDTGYNFLIEPRLIECGTQVTVLKCGAAFGAGRQIAFRAFAEPTAPAGQFHWRCTHPDPENHGGIIYVGARPQLWITQNLACFVELVPN